jgi:hypothetical protein
MSSVILTGDTSGTLTVSAPLVAGSNTLTLAAATGTLSPLVSATAVASTSGTSIDFTGIPSWAKRITVMFNGVSSSGTSNFLIQIGAGSVTTSGYLSSASASSVNSTSTTGLLVCNNLTAATNQTGIAVLATLGSNIWVQSSTCGPNAGGSSQTIANGNITLGGTLDRVRITTVNGTDTFDAGSINVMWEG